MTHCFIFFTNLQNNVQKILLFSSITLDSFRCVEQKGDEVCGRDAGTHQITLERHMFQPYADYYNCDLSVLDDPGNEQGQGGTGNLSRDSSNDTPEITASLVCQTGSGFRVNIYKHNKKFKL